jgi:hypothetical protein
MGARANQFINMTLAKLRKDNPEKLKEKPEVQEHFSSKFCPNCEAPRGTEHVDCTYSGRAIRG